MKEYKKCLIEGCTEKIDSHFPSNTCQKCLERIFESTFYRILEQIEIEREYAENHGESKIFSATDY